MVVGAPRQQSMRYNPDNTSPLNFWYLPAPCNVILYMFLLEADKVENITESTRPEIILAQKIYTNLKEVRDRVARRARFHSKPTRYPALGLSKCVNCAVPDCEIHESPYTYMKSFHVPHNSCTRFMYLRRGDLVYMKFSVFYCECDPCKSG
jgi:hypothetical protein